MDTEFQYCKIRVQAMDSVDGCTAIRMYLLSLNCILKNSEDGQFYVMCILHN